MKCTHKFKQPDNNNNNKLIQSKIKTKNETNGKNTCRSTDRQSKQMQQTKTEARNICTHQQLCGRWTKANLMHFASSDESQLVRCNASKMQLLQCYNLNETNKTKPNQTTNTYILNVNPCNKWMKFVVICKKT